jgi:hypothetical protein
VHNERLNNVYSSPNIRRMMNGERERERENKIGGACILLGDTEKILWNIVGKLEGKTLLERPSIR